VIIFCIAAVTVVLALPSSCIQYSVETSILDSPPFKNQNTLKYCNLH